MSAVVAERWLGTQAGLAAVEYAGWRSVKELRILVQVSDCTLPANRVSLTCALCHVAGEGKTRVFLQTQGKDMVAYERTHMYRKHMSKCKTCEKYYASATPLSRQAHYYADCFCRNAPDEEVGAVPNNLSELPKPRVPAPDFKRRKVARVGGKRGRQLAVAHHRSTGVSPPRDVKRAKSATVSASVQEDDTQVVLYTMSRFNSRRGEHTKHTNPNHRHVLHR
jgi:hypothetical protein